MSVRTEIKGNRYGKWTALWDFYLKPLPCGRKRCYELVRCDCWTEQYIRRESLLSWKSKCCRNCTYSSSEYRTKLSQANSKPKTHGMTHSAFYKKFRDILSRCNNKNIVAYSNYWARGIKCLRIRFEDFYNDMYESYLEHCNKYWERQTTIDRIDVDWNYCKENCKRSTFDEQNHNKRNLQKYKNSLICNN